VREIKTLMAELRNYPNNLFVYPKHFPYIKGKRLPANGLAICGKDGKQVGFIDTGINDGNVVI